MSLRIGLAILALVAVIGLGLYVVHLRKEVATARLEATAAHQEAGLSQATVKATDHYVSTTQIIHDKEGAAVDVVRALPTSETPLDPDFAAGLGRQLDGVRLGSVAPGDKSTGKPAGSVPVGGS